MNVEDLRRGFAEVIGATAGVSSRALIDAFAHVPRERFLGPGPWKIAQVHEPGAPYRDTPDARLEHIHGDVAVAIDPARLLNNGQPSALARFIDAAAPGPGDSVLHVGCGVGYYTAILADIVGPTGRVVGCDIDPDLVARARENLAPWPQAQVEVGDGSEPRGPHDAIFVNAGVTHARPEWITALAEGGRLVLPLTVHMPQFPYPNHGIGAVIAAERRGTPWPARVVSPVGIYDCAGARDEAAEAQLRTLMVPGAAARLRALSIDPHPRGDACLFHLDGFCLQS